MSYTYYLAHYVGAVVEKTASDTYTLEDGIDAVVEVQQQRDASDTYTLEDGIDVASLDVSGPIEKVAADTYTLEDDIEGTTDLLVAYSVSDTYTLEDDIDVLQAISAEMAAVDTYTLESEIDSVLVGVEFAVSDTYTLEETIDIAQVRVSDATTGGLRWHLFVDWQGDGNFTDEIAYVIFPVNIQRGHNDLNDKVGIGTAQITLDNYTGRFGPLRAAGPLWPWITGNGIPFQFSYELFNETHPIFTGYIDDIKQLPLYEAHQVLLQCVDVANILASEEIRDQLYENEYTGTIFAALIESSFPYIQYDQLVLENGAVGYWRLLTETDELVEDSFESLIGFDNGPITTLCFNMVGPAETGQPWQLFCEEILAGPSDVNHIAQYTRPLWAGLASDNPPIDSLPAGVELFAANQTRYIGGFSYLPDHHMFLVADSGSENISHRVVLAQQTVHAVAEAGQGVERTSAYGALTVIRFSDIENCIYVQQTLTGYSLIKLQANVKTVLDTVVMAVGLTDEIQIDAYGNDIAVSINGSEVMSASDSFNQTATKHGIGRWLEMSSRSFEFNYPTKSPDMYLRFGSIVTYQKTAFDLTTNINNGIYYGIPGVLFDGEKYVDIGDPALFDLTDNFALEIWYRRDGSGVLPLVGKKLAYGFKEDASNIPYAFVYIGGVQYATPTAGLTPSDAGTSYYLVLRRVGTALQLYRNGTLLSEVTIPSSALDTNTNSLLIGREDTVYLDGQAFDIALYSPASTATEIQNRYLSKTLFGLNRNISRGQQQLEVYAPSGNKIWDAGQELAYEELGGHAFVTKEGVVTFQDRWDLSREPVYISLENTGLVDAPIEVNHDDNYDRVKGEWGEFNLFDEENQWIIWNSVVVDGENHARMNKVLKPGSTAPQNTFTGTWEKSGIQISPGQIDVNTDITYIATSQPSPGDEPYDDATSDVVIEEFIYDDVGYEITFNNLTDEDRYIYNIEIRTAAGAVIQKLPIAFVYQRTTGFPRKTGRTREYVMNWNTDIDVIRSSVTVRSKIGKTIHPRPDGLLSDVNFQWLRAILDADIGKRIAIREDNHLHSSYMDDEYIIKGIQLSITKDEVQGIWSLWDKILAEANYFIIGQDVIDGERWITF